MKNNFFSVNITFVALILFFGFIINYVVRANTTAKIKCDTIARILNQRNIQPEFCPCCGYDLQQLTNPVCPECGQQYSHPITNKQHLSLINDCIAQEKTLFIEIYKRKNFVFSLLRIPYVISLFSLAVFFDFILLHCPLWVAILPFFYALPYYHLTYYTERQNANLFRKHYNEIWQDLEVAMQQEQQLTKAT
ncbi:hypothetical protein JD969_10035 [Planctomycetota bacterium]|nr:hypothetical protein JD969_10035 [Planctomycetota bacterium]